MTAGFPQSERFERDREAETETDAEREGGGTHREVHALISRTHAATSDILYSRQATC